MKRKILIVEDEFSINEILRISLGNEGYETKSSFDIKSTEKIIYKYNPDLILLDAMLPDGDGFELCKKISKDFLVVMVTAKDTIFDKIVGIELGADDYITKPFEIKEVVVRVKAIFRMLEKENKSGNMLKLNENIIIDLIGERVYKDSKEILFKRKESELFFYFLNNRNRVLRREELLNNVWGYDYYGGTRTVDVHVRRIREKIDVTDIDIIETVFGKGYVMR